MIADLKRIGSSPDFTVKREWPVVRLWRIARIRSEKNRPDLPLLSVFLGRGVIAYGEGCRQVHKPGQDLSIYQVVREGDFVLNNQQAWRGSVGVSKHHGIISPAYVILALSDALNPRFADYLFQSRVMVAQFVTSSKGVGDIQRDIHIPWMKNTKVPVPPLDEQAAIVRFLDYANRRLERAIRAKRKVIALLNEQKQAIIHRAITRGLDSNVTLKPSCIPWLGEIPAHWEVKRIKWVTQLQRGYDLPQEHRKRGTVPVVSSGGVIDTHCEARAQGPGVVMGRYGSTDAVFYIEQDFWPHNTSLFVTNFYDNFPKWCFYLLRTISKSDYSSKSAVPGVDRKDLYEIYVPQPPHDKQVEIVQGIEQHLQGFNTAINRTEREITLLHEYRTRLIADVVMGKLDVREAARLPIEPDEPETFIEADLLNEGGESFDGDVEMIAGDAEDSRE